jgi:hypothetical protein
LVFWVGGGDLEGFFCVGGLIEYFVLWVVSRFIASLFWRLDWRREEKRREEGGWTYVNIRKNL